MESSADLVAAREEAARLDEECHRLGARVRQAEQEQEQALAALQTARDLLRQATRATGSMPGHAEVVGALCGCRACAALRQITGWGKGPRWGEKGAP